MRGCDVCERWFIRRVAHSSVTVPGTYHLIIARRLQSGTAGPLDGHPRHLVYSHVLSELVLQAGESVFNRARTRPVSTLRSPQAVATARPCYVCHKPTSTVLATIQLVDFLYSCDTHLSDPGFASQVGQASDGMGAGGAKMGLSPEEIAKVKQEWEERQKKKQEKKSKEKDKDASEDGDGKSDKKAESGEDKSSKSPPSSTSPPSTLVSSSTKPSHERYTLHRDIFALRLAEHRRRRQAIQAKELAPRLPGAPRAALPPGA